MVEGVGFRQSPASYERRGYNVRPQTVPCGRCRGCRHARSLAWATRCVHEASLHKQNTFVTLTFAPEHLPDDWSLDVRHFQLFMKRLRKEFGSGIRFYHCGEYGEKYGRPHYHAILFGLDFPDRRLHEKTPQGHNLYTSRILDRLWPYGHALIGDVTFQSAAYVARYIFKKINGDLAEEHYTFTVPTTGEIVRRKPEYTTMSRRPGIAHEWFKKFKSDVFPRDEVIIRGKKFRPPRYYDRQYELTDPEDFEMLKLKRLEASKAHADDNTPERLAVKEKVFAAQLSQLTRNVDNAI